MIPELMIRAWQNQQAPWSSPTMVEQDLILSRCLVMMYQQAEIRDSLVFRGGTALNKLYINPAVRYSEDLDFVQIKAGPIGSVINSIRYCLDSWLGEPKRKLTERGVKIIYRFMSSENLPAKLKIEINTTEHYHILDLVENDFAVHTDWYDGDASIITYQLDELMGTKLRALYQRRKGRDLFDLWYVIKNNMIDTSRVIDVFTQHNERCKQRITGAMFGRNLDEKRKDSGFSSDMKNLIHPKINYDFDQACIQVNEAIIEKLCTEANIHI